MNDELKQQMQNDIDLAKAMIDINSPAEVMNLTNKLIGYLDLVLTAKADLSYKLAQMEGKKRILEEFIRTGKARHKELSDLNNRF